MRESCLREALTRKPTETRATMCSDSVFVPNEVCRGNLYDQKHTRDRGETLVVSTAEALNDRIPNRVLAFDSVTNQLPLRSAPVNTTLLVLQFLH